MSQNYCGSITSQLNQACREEAEQSFLFEHETCDKGCFEESQHQKHPKGCNGEPKKSKSQKNT